MIAALILAAAAPAVTVEGGRLEGVTLPSGVSAYLGVPFAAPPVRDLRWKPPQPAAAWAGTLHADRFAPECLQPLRGSRQNHYFGEEATSEDCLYLNIWAPPSARKAPVVVWIFGGGFNIGSASMANYSGEPLARDGVVRVNIAYRVGPLGFFAHPELSAEGGGRSGNYGLMDQIAALQWVKRNIARFGGDPDNVTIVGQSAGSMSVSLLQISPLARGLFRQAVGMSGSAFGGMIGPVSLAEAEAQGTAFQKTAGAASLADLRAMPGDRLLAVTAPREAIVRDGRVVTGSADEVFAAGGQAKVPVLIGYTRDEAFGPLGPVTDAASLAKAVTARLGADAPAVLKAYGDVDPARAATDIARDGSVGRQMASWAVAQQKAGSPAYPYLFARRQPYTAGITFSDHDPATVGAYHSGDVPYWLGTRDSLNLFRRTRDWQPGDVALEVEMRGALLAFAHTGRPASRAVGAWPVFDPAQPRLVRLDVTSAIEPWPHFTEMSLLKNMGRPPRAAGARPRD